MKNIRTEFSGIPVTPGALLDMRGVDDVNISPDGKYVAFVVWQRVPGEKIRTGRIWIVETAGNEPRPLTKGPGTDSCPRWSPDSQQVAFISAPKGEGSKGKPQLSLIPIQGGDAKQVCEMPNGVSDLAWSPDGSRVAFISLEGEEPKTDPRVITPGRHRRLWTVRPGGIPEPVTPDGSSVWEYAWSPDSKQMALFYSNGPEETDWFRGQIGIVSAPGGAIRQIFQLSRQASGLTWSPDSSSIAYISGEWSDPGPGAGDLFILPIQGEESLTHPANVAPIRSTNAAVAAEPSQLANDASASTTWQSGKLQGVRASHSGETQGEARNLTPGISVSVGWCRWFSDGRRLLFAAIAGVTHQIGILDEAEHTITLLEKDFVISTGWCPALSPTSDLRTFATLHGDSQHPSDVWLGTVNEQRNTISWKPLTRLNPLIEETYALARNERISYESVDGWRIDGLFTPPLFYTSDGLPPLVVNVHGGPSGAWSDDFDAYMSQILASAGYAVLHPNVRGSWGRGVAFADAVIGDMGGKDFQDILAGIDYLVKQGLVDGKRVGIAGWSYGGYMAAWAVTQTTRFKAAMMGAGISDWHNYHAQSSLRDSDLRFLAAHPSENSEVYRARSPITYAARVTTPTLILHGENDEAVPVAQAYAFYRALLERDVPVELVVYPRAGHGVRERDHVRDAQERMLRWFKQYLV